jgi:hypothetical protein
MMTRIGNVLYWLACIIAGLIAILGVYVYIMEGHSKNDGVAVTAGFFVAAFVAWLIGRAALYIFAAR